MSTSRLLTSRRSTIALALVAPLTLTACELDPPSATFQDAPSAEPIPDAVVVASARTSILLAVASVESVTAAHPRLGPELSPWLALHAAHLDVLDNGSQDSLEDEVLGADPPAPRENIARRQLLAHEAELARSLADAAQQAVGGDLARALASMSAALRQRAVA